MSLSAFPIDESYLVAGWLESFFWGFYTLMFSMTMYGIWRRRRHGVNLFTTGSIILLYALATTHMALALVRLIQGFVLYRDTIGPILYFANISVRLNMAKDYIYITNIALGDLVVVWRLYVVWGRNLWISVLPISMVVGEFVAGYGSISQWLLPNPVPETMVRWGTAMFAISLSTNVLVTAMIASRIWYITARSRGTLGVSSNNCHKRVILLIIESGALISAAKIIEFVLFKLAPLDGLNGLNALYIVYDAMPQITGLVPTVIVYSVNHGFTETADFYSGAITNTVVLGTRSGVSASGTDSSLVTFPCPHPRHDLDLDVEKSPLGGPSP
ncbi:hypothetical protein L226DRAFT_304251 [Lentinus tigrinus ALCF2SS1-7]|uniref:Uncharacterized protein n=1 Tax=Lentinus tigrinus ALCF2SS1-6 TaxID=1328759 RepID=A0A5C2RTG3_9APHY|nr:hypothetical protein L227DRAFT_512068 [Lentinus tigrinus ALCF2SS1-6]RPD69174.1 hypothetical protein L226DRAFT_304251 [Lentinus tigrinus ALCF2SS1-7]